PRGLDPAPHAVGDAAGRPGLVAMHAAEQPRSADTAPAAAPHIRRDGSAVLELPDGRGRHRLGPAEYRFYASVRSGRTFEAASDAARVAAPCWSAESGRMMLAWMRSHQVADGVRVDPPRDAPATGAAPPRPRGVWNPLMFRVPLGSPQPLLVRCRPLLARAPRAAALWVAVAAVLAAAAVLLTRWPAFAVAYGSLVTPGRVLSVGLAWLALRLVHEVGHAVACFALGGEVTSAGCLFVAGAPLTYVDVSSSARLPTRRQRLTVALAGIAAELLLAAVLILLWGVLPTAITLRLAADALLAVAVGTLLFNLNPLMKFDGYFVLMEVTGLENLYERGAAAVAGLLGRFVWGRRERPAAVGRGPWPVLVYGVAAAAWRVVAVGCVCAAAVAMLGPLGTLLSVLLVCSVFLAPAWRAWRRGWAPASTAERFRAVTRVALSVGATLLAAHLTPAPAWRTAPVVVEQATANPVCCGAEGFLAECYAKPGQRVAAGEPIALLRNDWLHVEARRLESQAAIASLRRADAVSRGDAPLASRLRLREAALQEQLTTIKSRVANLTVVAPSGGAFLGKDLSADTGKFLRLGDAIGQVGDAQSRGFTALVEARRADEIAVGRRLDVRTSDGRRFRAAIASIEPRAISDATPSPFSAANGGPLPVLTDGDGQRFDRPYRRLRLAVDSSDGRGLRVGQRGWAAFSGERSMLCLLAAWFAESAGVPQ
ncbi:MAG: hypothetical protein AAF790_08565, partial [Planctomycetota bacterium]